MTASRDTERLIRAFLDEGVTELPERVYHAVRSDIDRTHQRVVIGPWRTPDMNTFAKFAMAAAAVLVVALVGYNLLPSDTGSGGTPAVSPSPSPSPSPSITASQLPSPPPSDYAFFPNGPIEAGRHPMVLAGKSLTVDMPPGWISHLGFRLHTGSSAAAFIFWTPAPSNVYADPCAHEPLDPPAGDTPAERAAAISSIPGTELVGAPSNRHDRRAPRDARVDQDPRRRRLSAGRVSPLVPAGERAGQWPLSRCDRRYGQRLDHRR